jgi:uncharacterized phage protein gp47/JayE
VAFERPTLTALVEQSQADFLSRLTLTGAVLRRSVVNVLARVIAGAVHMLYGLLQFLSRQVFPDTAEAQYLLRWADLYGLQKKAADYAHGTVTFTGTDGAEVEEGAVLVRGDGNRYSVDAGVVIASGTATADVTALTAGAAATLTAAEPLSLESPLVGVSSSATAASSTVDGTDEETDEELRARLKARIGFAPHGGAENDYIKWATEVPGVTRAWVYPLELGAGTVTVRFVRDDDPGSIIPSAGEVTAVQDYIDVLRPVNADLTVVAPVADTQNFTISITPDTTATRTAVEAELEDMLRREVEPGGTMLLSQVELAVGNAEGITDFTITSPATDTTYTTGHLPTMGTVTWV